MGKNEANFDLYIYELLKDAGISATAQGSEVLEIKNALKTATKKRTGRAVGYPEYTAVVRDFVIVMEDKPDRSMLVSRDELGEILLTAATVKDYALNGALHYANHIIEHTCYKRVFAFGNAGDRRHHILKPIYVDASKYKELPEVETFENFSENNIDEYYSRVVLGEEPPEDMELSDILKKAKALHEHLWKFGSLGEDEKALVVSAILLALREQKRSKFSLDSLVGDDVETDGDILYKQLEKSLKAANVRPEVKLKQVLNQFTLIKDRPNLNEKHPLLEKTPLKFFTEYINENIFKALISNSAEDFLGRFYGEFVSYSGGDGQTLGVVLTPRHITELFCELVDLKPTDVVFDPCCGTGGFLVSSMHKMLRNCNSKKQKHIKELQIYGIEAREDMFAIATTNMILRGDGQSNLICGDFFKYPTSELQLEGGGVTVGLMNPPYSQAKDKTTAGLSELCFIRQLLNSVTSGGRVAVIVPVSAMIGKTKDDRVFRRICG
jgi:DNA-binding ferritin-like protein (Dps family)